MDSRQKLIVQSTFERAQPNLERVGRQLYQRMFVKYPEMRKLFISNIRAQHMCFAMALADIIKKLDQPAECTEMLRDMGARHARYGIGQDNFVLIEPLLIVTIRLTTGLPFNRETYKAWRQFCKFMITEMMAGYAAELVAQRKSHQIYGHTA